VGGFGGDGGTGNMGGGGTGALTDYAGVWTFDSDTESFEALGANPGTLAVAVAHNDTLGSPMAGSLSAQIDFGAPDQAVEVGVHMTSTIDLSQRVLRLRVLLQSGLGTAMQAGDARAFVRTGEAFLLAAGPALSMRRGQWVELSLDLEDPNEIIGTGSHDPIEVFELGALISTGGVVAPTPATVLVDQVGY
jgi:hypothetical protein